MRSRSRFIVAPATWEGKRRYAVFTCRYSYLFEVARADDEFGAGLFVALVHLPTSDKLPYLRRWLRQEPRRPLMSSSSNLLPSGVVTRSLDLVVIAGLDQGTTFICGAGKGNVLGRSAQSSYRVGELVRPRSRRSGGIRAVALAMGWRWTYSAIRVVGSSR